jgi:hypothetical protein
MPDRNPLPSRPLGSDNAMGQPKVLDVPNGTHLVSAMLNWSNQAPRMAPDVS